VIARTGGVEDVRRRRSFGCDAAGLNRLLRTNTAATEHLGWLSRLIDQKESAAQ
jgi:hypothetical protein